MKKFILDLFICLSIAVVIKIIIQAMIYPNFLNINQTINWGYDWSGYFWRIVTFKWQVAVILGFVLMQFRNTKM